MKKSATSNYAGFIAIDKESKKLSPASVKSSRATSDTVNTVRIDQKSKRNNADNAGNTRKPGAKAELLRTQSKRSPASSTKSPTRGNTTTPTRKPTPSSASEKTKEPGGGGGGTPASGRSIRSAGNGTPKTSNNLNGNRKSVYKFEDLID
uniref:Uncharacterized protein n=1 Tax=Cacopsylla melanoneura TaxID=428564 RepID=A0A8D8W104_9HEMI